MATESFLSRPLAITDVETSGLDERTHEVLEIGLVLADQNDLSVLDRWSVKVKPSRIELANPMALQINGYRPEDWTDAVPLAEAMAEYARRTEGAMLYAHNSGFDGRFIRAAFRESGVESRMDYHTACGFSIGWHLLRDSGLKAFSLVNVAEYFSLPPEPEPHRAEHGAWLAYLVLVKLAELKNRKV